MWKRLIVGFITVVGSAAIHAELDLTGVWKGDDGGTYYVRQDGHHIHWYGEQRNNNPAWSNVFEGQLSSSGKQVKGKWADVPKGRTNGKGMLRLQVNALASEMRAISKSGGFGGNKWTRPVQMSVVPQPIPAKPLVAAVTEDCVTFNPDTAEVKNIKGRWKIVDGSHWVFDFDNKEAEARSAMKIIERYKINRSCFVGRPDPSFSYLLSKRGNGVPSGKMPGEDCVSFNPDTIEVKELGGRWKIVDGSHLMFDFGNNESEARQSWEIIRKHKFNRSCFVGRPDPSFTYLHR